MLVPDSSADIPVLGTILFARVNMQPATSRVVPCIVLWKMRMIRPISKLAVSQSDHGVVMDCRTFCWNGGRHCLGLLTKVPMHQ